MKTRRHVFTDKGFTLVEVMIVVVIMAILAATVIPQFTSSSDDARNNTALFNVHTLRSQVQLYKSEHRGDVPTLDGTENELPELLAQTDEYGTIGAGSLGPYLEITPNNPYTGSNKFRATATDDPPVISGSGTDAGWLYHEATGKLWLDHADFLDK